MCNWNLRLEVTQKVSSAVEAKEIFYKLAIHSLSCRCLPTGKNLEILKLERQHSDNLKDSFRTNSNKHVQCPNIQDHCFHFCTLFSIGRKHACVCLCSQPIYISFSLPNRPTRHSVFLWCPLIMVTAG